MKQLFFSHNDKQERYGLKKSSKWKSAGSVLLATLALGAGILVGGQTVSADENTNADAAVTTTSDPTTANSDSTETDTGSALENASADAVASTSDNSASKDANNNSSADSETTATETSAVSTDTTASTSENKETTTSANTSASDGTISFDGSSVSSTASGVIIDGTTVTITSAGTYTLTGNGVNYTITVAASVTDPVTLNLDSLTLTDSSIKSESSADLTINVVSDSSVSSTTDNAVETSGALSISSSTGSSLALASSEQNAISADSLTVDNATLNLTSDAKDGIHVTKSVVLNKANLTITAADEKIMDRLIIIRRPTRLDALVARFNTKQQAQFYIEHLNADFKDYEAEHETYYAVLDRLVKTAQGIGNVQVIDWKFLPNFIFGKNDTVITVGQDGLIANTLKYLEAQKLIGINPDPSRWDGVLSQFSVDEAGTIIRQALNDEVTVKQVTKAKVQLSDNQVLYAVNDFFIGVKNHASARYAITVDGAVENQSSSGIIVSTPLGRSGWMKSVLAGASGITGRLSKQSLAIKAKSVIDWGKEQLTFAVREPFPSVNTGAKMIFGSITPETRFLVESKMGENGIIFSDGIQDDYLDFNYSVTARISIADSKGMIVVK